MKSNTLTDFVNGTETASLGSVVNQILWAIGSVAFTTVTCILLLSGDAKQQSLGEYLATALLSAWTGKSIISAASRHGVRRTSREYMAGQATLSASKGQPVVVEARDQTQVNVAAADGAGGSAAAGAGVGAVRTVPAVDVVQVPVPDMIDHEEPEWATGDPRGGRL